MAVRSMRLVRLIIGILLVLLAAGVDSRAQSPVSPPDRTDGLPTELTVGIKLAPPFAYKLQDGAWSGLSVDLWKRIADALPVRYRFVEVETVQEQIDGVASGKFDAATAAITVTAERERAVDFTQPFYATGLGIAIPLSREPSWRPLVNALTSFGFVQAILALIGISLLVGLLIWLFERRHNDHFGGGAARGMFASLWWATNAATQATTGDFGPRTVPGQVLAVVWMIGSILGIAIFTAGVTSVLTVKQLEGLVQGEGDLKSVRVGNVEASSTAAYLDTTQVRHRGYPTVQAGLEALRAGQIDAFVYDRPLLNWLIAQNYATSLQLLDSSFVKQNYAIALPDNSPLRKPLNVRLIETVESDWWKQQVFQYLGEK
jgi:polar amino acid transport system substrate-binding protein